MAAGLESLAALIHVEPLPLGANRFVFTRTVGVDALAVLDGDTGVVTDLELEGIAATPNGDVIASGTFSEATSLGGAVIDPGARYRAFYTRYRDDGLIVIGARAAQFIKVEDRL